MKSRERTIDVLPSAVAKLVDSTAGLVPDPNLLKIDLDLSRERIDRTANATVHHLFEDWMPGADEMLSAIPVERYVFCPEYAKAARYVSARVATAVLVESAQSGESPDRHAFISHFNEAVEDRRDGPELQRFRDSVAGNQTDTEIVLTSAVITYQALAGALQPETPDMGVRIIDRPE